MSRNYKILIIEDEPEYLKNIHNVLQKERGFDYDNIFPRYENVEDFTREIEEKIIDDTSITNLSDFIITIIRERKIDALIIDLQLDDRKALRQHLSSESSNNESSKKNINRSEGIRLIRELKNDDSVFLQHIPIIIFTGLDTQELAPWIKSLNIQIVEKHSSTNISNAKNRLSKDIFSNLDDHVSRYKQLKAAVSSNSVLADKLDLLLKLQTDTYRKVLSIDDRTEIIEYTTKKIVTSLPIITKKAQAKKLIEDWGKDDVFKDIMGNSLPLVQKSWADKIENMKDGLEEKTIKEITTFVYESGKEALLTYIDNEAGINDKHTKLQKIERYTIMLSEKLKDISTNS